jgi:hypothetical protein
MPPAATGSRTADWAAYPDVLLLHTIASAVVRLADIRALDSFTLPYPAEAQRALDRLVMSCLLRGIDEMPRSVPDLLSWCRTRPLEDWPLSLPPDAFGPDDLLVDPDAYLPTQLCHEWWIHSRDSAAARFDRDVIRTAMRLCQQAGMPESYTAFRRLLVAQPVLTGVEKFNIATDLLLDPVTELIERCYEPAPISYRRGGVYQTCGRCMTLLLPLPDEGWWCERDACRRRGPAPTGRALDDSDSEVVYQLARPLRQFVTGPGRAEADLETRLSGLRSATAKVHVEMWPGFDAYDLRITFPDGHVWAIDVKDWKHPCLLGRAAKPVPGQPPYDESCWVVPQEQVDAHGDYLATYRRNVNPAAYDLPLLTDRQLVDLVRSRLRGDVNVRLAAPSTRKGGLDAEQ